MAHGIWTSLSRIAITATAVLFLQSGANMGVLSAQTQAGENGEPAKKTAEPVFRVSKLNGEPKTVATPGSSKESNDNTPAMEGKRVADSSALPSPTKPSVTPVVPVASPSGRAPHPLDRAVDIAETSLVEMQSNVRDYTAILQKREQINGVISPPSFMSVKVRCPRTLADGTQVPFSIYMKFLKPKEAAGREVIWVKGQNEGKLIAHEAGGLLGMRRFYLDPDGFLAMKGQRYPIYDAGLENLVIKLIEKAERDRAAGPCEVNYRDGAEINKRSCSLIELIHDDRGSGFDFHKAQVFLDDELNLPVRYVAYDWPETAGGKPKLIEEYTYYNVKVNVGLTDKDFSPDNKKYRYPKR